jgi:hypothetical protein
MMQPSALNLRPILSRSPGRREPPTPQRTLPEPSGYYVSVITATHNAHLAFYFFFERFQIGLPPEQIAIILHTDWHRTGGCHPISTSELPP